MKESGLEIPNRFDVYSIFRTFDEVSKLAVTAALESPVNQELAAATAMQYRLMTKPHLNAFMRHLIQFDGLFSRDDVKEYREQAIQYWQKAREDTPRVSVEVGATRDLGRVLSGKNTVGIELVGAGAELLLEQRNNYFLNMNRTFGGPGITKITKRETKILVPIATSTCETVSQTSLATLDNLLQGKELVLTEPRPDGIKFKQAEVLDAA